MSCFGIKGFKYLSCFGIKCKRFKYFSLPPSANNVDWGQDLARFRDLLKYILGRVQRKVPIPSLFQGMRSQQTLKSLLGSLYNRALFSENRDYIAMVILMTLC